MFEARAEVMGGKVCLKGTRVPLECVLDVINAGWDDQTILREFPTVTADHLRAVHELIDRRDGCLEVVVA